MVNQIFLFFSFFYSQVLGFNHTTSSPEYLRMYSSPLNNDRYSMMEQSLVDDARAAYEYGLPSTATPNDFSFVDQRIPMQQTRQAHHSWFGTPNQQQHPFINRTFSMPQQQTNEMNAAMIMQQQQQQNWARQQQMFPMQQQPQELQQV
jgi:hypothetical protein